MDRLHLSARDLYKLFIVSTLTLLRFHLTSRLCTEILPESVLYIFIANSIFSVVFLSYRILYRQKNTPLPLINDIYTQT